MRVVDGINRRDFLKSSSLAFACLFVAGGGYQILSATEAIDQKRYSPFVWFSINDDNSVTIFSNKSEMGQGIHTGITIVVADELDVDISKTKIVPAPVTSDYVDPYLKMHLTGGSTSMKHMYEPLRVAAATAREMLISAAAQKWGVHKNKCLAQLGYVKNTISGEKIEYGKLVEAASKLQRPSKPNLKKPSEFRYMGKDIRRIDMFEKSTGRAKFGLDYRIDGMLYASVSKPSKFGAKVVSFDENSVQKVDGFIKAVPLENGMAFVAKTLDAAFEAKRASNIKYDDGLIPKVDDTTIKKELNALMDKKGDVAIDRGNATKVIKGTKRKLSATYNLPYLHHMLMEPLNCIADVRSDSCKIIAGTQNQTAALMAAKQITGLPEEKIDILTTYLGTGLGRRAGADFVADALVLSKTMNAPVKLQQEREDEIATGRFRPASAHKIDVALDDERIVAWRHHVACEPVMKRTGFGSKEGADHSSVEGIVDTIYSLPAMYVESHDYNLPIPIWFWRSVGNSQNGFVMETMMDELAFMAQKDPIDFRLEHLSSNTRATNLLKKVATMSEWDKKPTLGEAKGCAIHQCFGSIVAEVAEISLDRDSGQIKVHRVDCAIDMGPFTVHKDSVVAQMEGAIIMGISQALFEAVHIKDGGISNSNFHDYQVTSMSDAPEVINVEIINSDGKPGGIGEPGLPPISPAIANALFKITSLRARTLPLSPQKISDALKSEQKYIS